MLENLQALRAFAALNVVYFHILGAAAARHQQASALAFLSGWGINGVDIFFVISGFVMVYTQARNPKPAGVFMRNRLTRIVPVYWLLSAGMLAVALAFPAGFTQPFDTSAGHVLSSLLFASNTLSHQPPLLYVGWTLEYEMLFYAVFALSLLVRDARVAPVLAGLVLGGLVASGTIGTIALEFVFGMACARAYIALGRKFDGVFMAAAGAAILLLTIRYGDGVDRVWRYGLAASLLVLGLAATRPVKSGLLTYLGDASYSIYLIQAFAIPVFYRLSAAWLPSLQGDVKSLLALIWVAVLGCLVYQFLERPLLDRLRSRARGT